MVRRVFSSYSTSGHTKCTYNLDLPSIIDPLYWKKHRLSLREITLITDIVPSWYLWVSAMIYGKVCTWSSLRISFSDPYSVIVNNKLSAIHFMLTAINYHPPYNYQKDRISTLSHAEYDHTPPLPLYSVSKEVYQKMSTTITPTLFPQRLQQVPSTVMYVVHLLDQEWVPHRIEGDHILLVSLGSSNCQDLETDQTLPLCRQSLRCIFKGTEYLLTDECIWVNVDGAC